MRFRCNEACPVWFGQAIKRHWGLSDPAKLDGNELDIARAFRQAIATIGERVDQLLVIAQSDRASREDQLKRLIPSANSPRLQSAMAVTRT